MKIKLLLLLLFISTNTFFGQNTNDSIYINNIYSLFIKANQYIYTKQDSAYHYYNEINKLATNKNDFENLINSINASNKSAAHFYDLEKMKTNFKQLDSIILKNQTKLQVAENALFYSNSINLDKGIYYFILNDYEKSRKAFKEIIKTSKTLKDDELNVYHIELLTSAYSFIAKTYVNDGKYDIAKEYYKESIQILKLKKTDDIKRINRTYSLLAEVLKKQKQYKLSNKHFKKSLQHNLLNNGNSSSIVTEANHLLENYLSTSQKDSSKYYLNIMKDNLRENHPRWNVFHEAKAKILETENKYSEADKELLIALELIQKKWKDLPHNDVAEAYNKIGLLHAKFNNTAKALENFNLALQQFAENQSTINQATVLKILKNKAQALNRGNLFSKSITAVNKAIQTLDLLKPTFKNSADKLFLMEEAFPVFEAGLEATYNLYQTTKHDSLIDQAFYYAEKSKSVLLIEALLSTKATKFANIPKDIIETEQVLKSQINHLEKQLNKSKKEVLEDELFQLKNNYRELITTIETNYKTYYNLKYNTQVATVKELQDDLNNDEMLISYFYGNQSIYIIAITKDAKQISKQIVNTDLENLITEIYEKQSNPESDLQSLKSKTYSLYQKIIDPVLTETSIKKLVILSDGLLNYIPFEILSTNQDSYNYLIEDYAISYANSATLQLQLKERQTGNNKLLAFAPDFKPKNETEQQLLSLPHNKKEVEQISTYFSGKPLINNEATLDNFMLEAPNYSIFHLATHAIVDDTNPEFSYLAFTNSSDNNLLYVKDIYNLNINADLVTLSACETGIGDLKRGEGFISLARSFFYSGATSMASTLWKVNDASSTELMGDFYKHLSKGNTKDLAMQKTKLEFLKSNSENGLTHPYYWSGFVVSGNTRAITNSDWLWYLLGAFVVIMAGSRYRKRKKP